MGCLALLSVGDVLGPLLGTQRLPESWEMELLWPPFAVAVVASSWPQLTRLLARAPASPVGLAVAVNVLNMADAVLTTNAIDAGEAAEANPMANLLGMPLKVVVVAGASVWLAKERPRALVWPLLALAAVFAWHLTGVTLRP